MNGPGLAIVERGANDQDRQQLRLVVSRPHANDVPRTGALTLGSPNTAGIEPRAASAAPTGR